MPGDNFSRRVARAAAVGGGRTYRSGTSMRWSALVLAICLGGVGLVAYSRYERIHPTVASVAPSVPPTAKNEWRVAVAVDVCGTLKPSALPVTTSPQAAYIDFAQGVVDIEPQRASVPAAFEGKNATLANFIQAEGITLSTGHLQIPSAPIPIRKPKSPKTKATSSTSTSTTSSTSTSTTSTTSTTIAHGAASSSSTSSTSTTSTSSTTTTTTIATRPGPLLKYATGGTCGGKPAVVEAAVWSSPTAVTPTIVTQNPELIRFKDGQLITIAFVAKGATPLRPPAAARKIVSEFLITDPNGVAPVTTTTLPISIPTTLPTTVTTKPSTGTSNTTTSVPSTSTTTSKG